MRLGATNMRGFDDPEAWIQAMRQHGYRAASFPLDLFADEELIRSYTRLAAKHDIVIAEVGGWGNVLADSERGSRVESIARAKRALQVAEMIGANCAVNIAGSRGANWDGPDAKNLTAETYEMIVETVRQIIDEVKPRRAFYCLEPMPWAYPCDEATQAALLRDIDRTAFGVHFDPVNIIYSPQTYFNNGATIESFVRRFGALIKSVHAKDTRLSSDLTMHFSECRPGDGALDYERLLRELERVSPDMPLIVEHLNDDADFDFGMRHIRRVAAAANIAV